MSIGTDKLAAATTVVEVMDLKSFLEIERENANKLYKEYTARSDLASLQAKQCRDDMYDVEDIMMKKIWAISNQ